MHAAAQWTKRTQLLQRLVRGGQRAVAAAGTAAQRACRMRRALRVAMHIALLAATCRSR
jgi:hypothetical protein